MDIYKEKVKKFTAVFVKPLVEEINIRKVCLKEGGELCHAIADGLGIEWKDEK